MVHGACHDELYIFAKTVTVVLPLLNESLKLVRETFVLEHVLLLPFHLMACHL
ncbi:hypothetical protein RchiOBHm_Chr3g0495291 [Rosa chinensis]|uniref:Uncharacterized protein n=1 Tax=Rosa chinensis TaxID=74649 RepID=A0A2P6RH68_ROSCH|nr:hypothetical protein RchiOBHm_Chr3g0495291 [Rosa chinensis]